MGTRNVARTARARVAGLFRVALLGSVCLSSASAASAAGPVASSLAELAREAATICTCRMVEQRNEWDGARQLMVTVVHLQAEEYLKGRGAPELVVELLSGFGDEKGRNRSAGTAFEQGERAVIFLKPAAGPAAEAQRDQIVNGAQGKFTIRTDPQTGKESVEWGWQGASPAELAALQTLEQLKAAIRGAVDSQADGQRAP